MDKIVEKVKYWWSKTNRFHRVAIIFLLAELKVLPKRQLGFYCKDPALSYPYNGDTVSFKWLIAVSLLLPLVVMLLTEHKYHNEDKQRPKKRALRWYKEYIYGFMLNLTAVDLLKLIVGSPRPHFFDTCVPLEASTCKESEFISSYTCTAGHWLSQSDRSFPSGHTSLAVHAGLFIVYYLHRRIRTPSHRVAQTAQALSTLLALFCAASRMSDHRHHWWDVAAGGVIALAFACYTTHNLCRKFQCRSEKAKTPDNDAKLKDTAPKQVEPSIHVGKIIST